jgi:hypothetical protein
MSNYLLDAKYDRVELQLNMPMCCDSNHKGDQNMAHSGNLPREDIWMFFSKLRCNVLLCLTNQKLVNFSSRLDISELFVKL